MTHNAHVMPGRFCSPPVYGGCAWETFGSAGCPNRPGLAHLRTAATLIRVQARRCRLLISVRSFRHVQDHAQPSCVTARRNHRSAHRRPCVGALQFAARREFEATRRQFNPQNQRRT
ncbi:hypothetical protein C3F00_026995 [Pseudomonas sp. MWU13-2860]|nr:hypothetical protein C3F00_026995 [Pseudomonas sp. MWU13-2860]